MKVPSTSCNNPALVARIVVWANSLGWEIGSGAAQ
jgi:hypothetical protein